MYEFQPPLSIITELKTPREYFSRYFPNETFQEMAEKTNLYAVQQHIPNFPATDAAELRKFVGINILMGNLQFPRVRLYWDSKLGIPYISQHMTVNRFFKLRTCVHIVDVEDQPANNDRFWKVRPYYDNIRRRCLQLPLELNLCIDEQMVPFKGHINVLQYMKDKPCKWGIKIFNLCGASGLLYDFIIYQGSTTEIDREYNAFGIPAATVMTLLRRVSSKGHHVFFDNWFSNYQLLQWLRTRDLYGGCTIRLDRFGKLPKKKKKSVVKKMGRGSSTEFVSEDGLVVTEWIDNKAVYMASNYVGIGTEDICERWVKKGAPPIYKPDEPVSRPDDVNVDTSVVNVVSQKELKSFRRPEIIREYNQSMGGVDRLDQLISLYRTFIRTKKWPLRMMTHAFDLSLALGWLEYKKDCDHLNLPKNQRLDLIHFRHEVAESLLMSFQVIKRKIGRPSKSPSPALSPLVSPASSRSPSPSPTLAVRDKPMREVRPITEVQYDQTSHWPTFGAPGRCKNDSCNLRTVYCCSKCNIHLCIVRERNCFMNYHNN